MIPTPPQGAGFPGSTGAGGPWDEEYNVYFAGGIYTATVNPVTQLGIASKTNADLGALVTAILAQGTSRTKRIRIQLDSSINFAGTVTIDKSYVTLYGNANAPGDDGGRTVPHIDTLVVDSSGAASTNFTEIYVRGLDVDELNENASGSNHSHHHVLEDIHFSPTGAAGHQGFHTTGTQYMQWIWLIRPFFNGAGTNGDCIRWENANSGTGHIFIQDPTVETAQDSSFDFFHGIANCRADQQIIIENLEFVQLSANAHTYNIIHMDGNSSGSVGLVRTTLRGLSMEVHTSSVATVFQFDDGSIAAFSFACKASDFDFTVAGGAGGVQLINNLQTRWTTWNGNISQVSIAGAIHANTSTLVTVGTPGEISGVMHFEIEASEVFLGKDYGAAAIWGTVFAEPGWTGGAASPTTATTYRMGVFRRGCYVKISGGTVSAIVITDAALKAIVPSGTSVNATLVPYRGTVNITFTGLPTISIVPA